MYTITEWSPSVAGEVVAEVEAIWEVVEIAATCYNAQITHPSWDGYVTTRPCGGASAKYFRGHNDHGLGGEIPEDAALLAARLDLPRD